MSKLTMKQIIPYLKGKGIPYPVIQMIRTALACDAVEEAGNLHWDRLYTAIALGLYRKHGFEGEELLDTLGAINAEMVRLEDDNLKWSSLMEELKEKTGVVVRTGDGIRLLAEITVDGEDENGKING